MIIVDISGELAEWVNAGALNTLEGETSVSSNLALSAKMTFGKDQDAKKSSIKAIAKKRETGVEHTPEFAQEISS